MKTKTIYQASDGTSFDTLEACQAYEETPNKTQLEIQKDTQKNKLLNFLKESILQDYDYRPDYSDEVRLQYLEETLNGFMKLTLNLLETDHQIRGIEENTSHLPEESRQVFKDDDAAVEINQPTPAEVIIYQDSNQPTRAEVIVAKYDELIAYMKQSANGEYLDESNLPRLIQLLRTFDYEADLKTYG
jgi:hypothetical protein